MQWSSGQIIYWLSHRYATIMLPVCNISCTDPFFCVLLDVCAFKWASNVSYTLTHKNGALYNTWLQEWCVLHKWYVQRTHKIDVLYSSHTLARTHAHTRVVCPTACAKVFLPKNTGCVAEQLERSFNNYVRPEVVGYVYMLWSIKRRQCVQCCYITPPQVCISCHLKHYFYWYINDSEMSQHGSSKHLLMAKSDKKKIFVCLQLLLGFTVDHEGNSCSVLHHFVGGSF